ncbi:MAG: nuclear transport factor 2 family protein [Thiohalophilus sp.]|jgi:ketosteroid isomerase-like protein
MTAIKLTTSSEAEEAFYAAFSRGDLQAMQELWLPSETTSCIHPMGDRLLGTTAILKSWETILRNTGDIIVETSDRVIHGDEQIAIHTLVENIHSMDKPEQIFRFVVTNIYQSTAGVWKMILHHASPMPHDTSQKESSPTVVH